MKSIIAARPRVRIDCRLKTGIMSGSGVYEIEYHADNKKVPPDTKNYLMKGETISTIVSSICVSNLIL
jgi:hypothetical protein